MPRPRILGSPRCKKPRNVDKSEGEETASKVVTIGDSEEPVCEIIKIEDTDEETEVPKLRKAPVRIEVSREETIDSNCAKFGKQTSARLSYRGSPRSTVVPPIPSMLSLQLVPNNSSKIAGNTRNANGAQNDVMVLPVSTVQSQIYNPTFCTLEKNEKPNDISQVVGMQQNARLPVKNTKQLNETRKKVLQAIFVHNSAENLRQTCESRISCITNQSTEKAEKPEENTSVSMLQDINSSVEEINAHVSVESIYSSEKSSKCRKEANLQPKKMRSNTSGSLTEKSRLGEFSETSSSLTSPAESIFTSKKSNDISNKSGSQKSWISPSESLIGNADSPESQKVSERPANGVNSVDKQKRSIFFTKKQTGGVNSSKTRENLSADSKIDKEGNSSKSQATAFGKKNYKGGGLWEVQCIVCKKNFTDRAELHRHATLAHPNMQILFCELCSGSFLTHSGLVAHRAKNCNPEILETYENVEILETIVIEGEEDFPQSIEKSKQLESEKTQPQPGPSRNENKTQKVKKKIASSIAGSKKLQIRRPSDVIYAAVKRGRPRKYFDTYRYVEEEVMSHATLATKKKLVSAEIKKLVVPLARLEGSTLEKYLEKRAEKPVTVFRCERIKKRGNFRKKIQRRRWRRNNYNNVGNVRKVKKPTTKILEMKKLTSSRSSIEKGKDDTFLRRDEKIFGHRFLRSAARNKTPDSMKKIVRKDADNDREAKKGKIRKTVDFRKKKRPMTESDESADISATIVVKTPVKQLRASEINWVIGIDNNLATKELPVIRKLPSRSSAASVVSLGKAGKGQKSRTERKLLEENDGESTLRQKKNVTWFIRTEKSTRKYPESESSPILLEKSAAESVTDTTLEEFDPEQFEEVTKESKKANVEEDAKNRQRNETDWCQEKIGSSKESVLPKTYLPSNGKVSIAQTSKRRSNETSYGLCSMCKELFALMKQLAGHFEGNKAKRISVKCPLCNLYFISMFYLEEHIAAYHLHCQSKITCKEAKTSLIAMSAARETSLECETEVELALECQQCSMKFSEEKDLNDHVFTQHDLPISYGDTKIDAPEYLTDLQSSCFQMSSGVSGVQFLSKNQHSDDKNAENLPISSKSANEKAVKNSPKTFLRCAHCNLSFENLSEYVRHVKKAHNLSPSSSVIRASRSADSSSEHRLTSLCTETESYSNKEILIASEFNTKDQTTVDREYLLKQLLSDDSMDNFEGMETKNVAKFSKQEIKKGFNRSKCQICYKKFKGTQDLLLHSLEHDSNASESSRNTSKAPQTEIREQLPDCPDYNWNDAGLVGSTALASTAEECGTTASMSKPIDLTIGDDIFASGDEVIEVSVENQTNKGSETEHDLKHRKMASLGTKSSNSEQTKKRSHRDSREPSLAISIVKAMKARTERLEALKELLETEDCLTNTDEGSANGKLPIECSKCNRKFPNRASLNEHLFFLHDDRLKDTVLDDVMSPQSRLGDENSSEPRLWRCDRCSHTFKLLQSYCRHRYLMHGDDEMVHVCENCYKVLTTVTMVNVHICTDVASYNCRTCNETFPTGMSLRLHNMDKHMETKGPHLCIPCNKKFLTSAMLKRHEKSKHCFLRPYRPRKSSPVQMATPESVSTKMDDDYEENKMGSECDEEYVGMEYEFTGREATEDRKTVSKTTEALKKKKRERPRMEEENPMEMENRALGDNPLGWNTTTTYLDEKEIFQCSLCQLYCLSKAALRTHKAKSHAIMAEVCRICEKMYSQGKLIRHMIDRHINPCESFAEDSKSIWNVSKNIEDKDAEELIRMLGMRRLISLCEYQRYNELTTDCNVACPTCGKEFENCEKYKYHFLMNHDVMCALCNIEFKSGDKAARHKIEEHDSVDSYIWFANKTVEALTAATNFSVVAEQTFMEMISRESDESSVESHKGNDDLLDAEDPTCRDKFEKGNDEVSESTREMDKPVNLSGDLAETDDMKIIIVVTNEDLEKYGIATKNPNIWGLASKISSTSEEFTPKDIKGMLESYFGS